jgi:hypothetical protein
MIKVRYLLCLVAATAIFFAPSAAMDKPAAPAEGKSSPGTFQIIVSKDIVDLIKTKPAMFGREAVDSMPLLTQDDIRYLRFDAAKWVETAMELMPGVYDRLRPRLPGLYMHSFVLLLNNEPVYSGILVANDFSMDYLKKSHYSGPVMLLPPKNAIPDKLNSIGISFISEDGIYRRKDDPRGNKAMIDFFKKMGKYIF